MAPAVLYQGRIQTVTLGGRFQ